MLQAAAKTNLMWMLVTAFWGCFIMTSSKTVRIYELLSVLAEKKIIGRVQFLYSTCENGSELTQFL